MIKQQYLDKRAAFISTCKNNNIKTIIANFSGGGDEGYIDDFYFINKFEDIVRAREIIERGDIPEIEDWLCDFILDCCDDFYVDLINNDGGIARLEVHLNDMSWDLSITEYFTDERNHHCDGHLDKIMDNGTS